MPDCCSDHSRVIRQLEALDTKMDLLATEITAITVHQDQVLPLVRGNGAPPLSERLARIETLQQAAITVQDARHKQLSRALWAVCTSLAISLCVWVGPPVLRVVEAVWQSLTTVGG